MIREALRTERVGWYRELRDAQAQIFELTESLADAREELDAVREINRELLADRNRAAR